MSDVLDAFASADESVAISLSTLREIESFGANPGNLRMWLSVPSGPSRKRPLVVVLHGCTQTAAGYDAASGWSQLGERHDFLVLYPEQQRVNNEGLCFSWFDPVRTRRGAGEVGSIRDMIAAAVTGFDADPSRVFVCGLSAGGAMAGAMLAAHPELFRGGALIAGLPYGTAANLHDAYESMSAGRIKDAKAWGDLVRGASGASAWRGPWPSIAIWHGTADNVVKPINAGELVKQWTNVHGVGASVPSEDHIGRIARRVWRDAAGCNCVIEYSVPGLGHGTPVDDVVPPAPFFLPAGISSAAQILRDWGLSRRKPRTLLSRLGF